MTAQGLMDIGDLVDDNIAIIQGWFPGATGGTVRNLFLFQSSFSFISFSWTISEDPFDADIAPLRGVKAALWLPLLCLVPSPNYESYRWGTCFPTQA